MKSIYVSKPCSENWETMSTQDKGKFCAVCDKCVIDFTEKKKQEIIEILEEKKDEKICGRFYSAQLESENAKLLKLKNQFHKYIPADFRSNRIVLTVFSLLLFLTGCSKSKTQQNTLLGDVQIAEDSIPKNDDYIMGEALIENDSAFNVSKKDSIIK